MKTRLLVLAIFLLAFVVKGNAQDTLNFPLDVPILNPNLCGDRLEVLPTTITRHISFVSPKSFSETIAIYKAVVNKNSWKVINSIEQSDLVFYYAIRENFTPGISVEHLVVNVWSKNAVVNPPCPRDNAIVVALSYLISLDAPNIVSLTPDSTVLIGEQLVLAVEATGYEPLTYEWFENNQKIGSGKTYSVSTLRPHTAKTYQVKVTDKNGRSTARQVRVAVAATPIVVFVPGIAGSKLVDEDTGEELWPAPFKWTRKERLFLVNGQSPTRVKATEVIGSVLGIRFYEDIIEAFPKAGYRRFGRDSMPTFFPFPYDWRLSNADNAGKLKDFVHKTIQEIYPNVQVNVISHSMGGLLARRYILDNQNTHSVRRLVTVGAPWLGTPKALDVLFTGRFLPEFWGLAQEAIISPDGLQDLAATFPSIHELLPGSLYHNLAGAAFGEDGYDFNADQTNNRSYSYADLITMLDRKFPQQIPGTRNLSFLGTAGQENGRIQANGVEYFHILGRNTQDQTISKLATRKLISLGSYSPFGVRLPAVTFAYFAREYGEGDGTVTLPSARRQGYNLAEDSQHILVQTGKAEAAGHSDMIKNSKVIDQLISIVKTGKAASIDQALGAVMNQDTVSASLTTIQVFGVTNLELVSSTGARWNPFREPDENNQPLEGLTIDKLGEEVMEIQSTLPQYSLEFAAGAKPLALLIIQGPPENPLVSIKYMDLALPPGSKSRVAITEGKPQDLSVDGNNDGTLETNVPPSIRVTGTEGQDIIPPQLTITYRQVREGIRVAITAIDQGGSGIKAVRYSLNGTVFTDYTGPFVLPIKRIMPTIHAFADDGVGNRSGLISVKPKARRRR